MEVARAFARRPVCQNFCLSSYSFYFRPSTRSLNCQASRKALVGLPKLGRPFSMATSELPIKLAAGEGAGTANGLLPVDRLDPYPNCYPDLNPFDVYRSHLTSTLCEITGVETKVVYQALQWTQTLDKGDMVLAVPALRVKGKKPNDLALEIVEKVCLRPYFGSQFLPVSMLTILPVSSQNHHSSRSPLRPVPFSNSISRPGRSQNSSFLLFKSWTQNLVQTPPSVSRTPKTRPRERSA